MKTPMYPGRRPQLGEVITLLADDGKPNKRVVAQVQRAKKAPKRWWYNMRVLILKGITKDEAGNPIEGMETGRQFDSISTCWSWPDVPQFKCEGWRRYGGAFLGPPRWERCTNLPTMMVVMRDGAKERRLPSCRRCMEELGQSDQKNQIIRVEPIA